MLHNVCVEGGGVVMRERVCVLCNMCVCVSVRGREREWESVE